MIIKNGLLIDDDPWECEESPKEPQDHLTLWVSEVARYEGHPEIIPDNRGYIYIPVRSEIPIKLGIKDGDTWDTAIKKLREYFGERLII